MLSVDASGGVHVGVNPLHPFADRPPTRRESFGVRMVKKGSLRPRRMANRRSVTSRAEFVKSPLNFDCP